MTNEPDKLAEAIKNMYATFNWVGELYDRAKVLEAALAYHDLPVVDVEELKSSTIKNMGNTDLPYFEQTNGVLYLRPEQLIFKVIDHLRTTYPNGFTWGKK